MKKTPAKHEKKPSFRSHWIFIGISSALIVAVGLTALFNNSLFFHTEEERTTSSVSMPSSFTLPQVTLPDEDDLLIITRSNTTLGTTATSSTGNTTSSGSTTSPVTSDENSSTTINAPDDPSVTTYDKLKYTIGNVWVSKSLKPYSLDHFAIFRETVDSEGRLTSEHSYVFIKIKIENQSDEERDYRLGSCWLSTIDQNNIKKQECELRFCDQGTTVQDPDFFKQHFAPHETREFVLGYVFKDINLQDSDLLFVINNAGTAFNETREYIKILMN